MDMGTKRNVLTYGIQVLVQFKQFGLFKTNDMGLGWFRSQNRLERRRPACTTLRLPQPMFKFYFRKFLTFWYKTFPAAAARETN
tara:strand:- start:597 stop:848 length:252 start_codon:yes stop_codon:yes gene_type:complete